MIASSIVPERVAIVFEGNRINFQKLQERVNRLANGMAMMGIEKGDRIATMQVNTNDLIEIYFASAKLDAIFVPLNFRARADELEFMLTQSKPSVFFVGNRYAEIVSSIPTKVLPDDIVALDRIDNEDWESYAHLIDSHSPDEVHFPNGDDEDITILMFTAGTTGTPKAVMLTHQSFCSYLLANVSPADPTMEERTLLSVPLYHIAGMQSVMAAVYGGRTLLLMRQFEPAGWMELAQKEKANRAMMVPTMLKQIMDHPRFHQYDLSSVEVITYGAAPMPLEVIKRAIERFPTTRFINAFGQTETASTITMLSPEDHNLTGDPELVARNLKRLTSIGKPLDDVEVSIVDHDGVPVQLGEVGEIVAKGPRIMKGYWGEEMSEVSPLKNGWLYTGDLGYQDIDGYIYLAGRAKDFIKRGGEMISPEEVEQTLMSHPGVDEAAIIGIPDVDWGERVRAIVVRKDMSVGAAELMEYCRERLASFKKPESVVFIDQLPRNPLGKVLKRVLRESYADPI